MRCNETKGAFRIFSKVHAKRLSIWNSFQPFLQHRLGFGEYFTDIFRLNRNNSTTNYLFSLLPTVTSRFPLTSAPLLSKFSVLSRSLYSQMVKVGQCDSQVGRDF